MWACRQVERPQSALLRAPAAPTHGGPAASFQGPSPLQSDSRANVVRFLAGTPCRPIQNLRQLMQGLQASLVDLSSRKVLAHA